jgi:hypothetical protein
MRALLRRTARRHPPASRTFHLLHAAWLVPLALAAVGRAEPPSGDSTRASLGDASYAPETRAAVDTVIGLFRRAPQGAGAASALGALLDETPTVVGTALEDARHRASESDAAALRAHARRLRDALGALERHHGAGDAEHPLARVAALAEELDAAAGERARARRSERLAALLARMRDGAWRPAPHVDPGVQPSSRWFTGASEDAGAAR